MHLFLEGIAWELQGTSWVRALLVITDGNFIQVYATFMQAEENNG